VEPEITNVLVPLQGAVGLPLTEDADFDYVPKKSKERVLKIVFESSTENWKQVSARRQERDRPFQVFIEDEFVPVAEPSNDPTMTLPRAKSLFVTKHVRFLRPDPSDGS
jgi:hypothetical protein